MAKKLNQVLQNISIKSNIISYGSESKPELTLINKKKNYSNY